MLNGKPDFTAAQRANFLERENAGLRAALNAKAQMHDLLTRVVAGVATNPSLTPEEIAARAVHIAGAVMAFLEKPDHEEPAPTEHRAEPTQDA